jgi:DNA/RNA-binding domain of Phe-tRNA-synthetase-like protein
VTGHLSYSPAVRAEFPALATAVVRLSDLDVGALAAVDLSPLHERALTRSLTCAESELPPIRAWRRAFAQLGYRPTQYRCAAESLLRRLRKDGALPTVNPLVDVANAVSVDLALPVAALDLEAVVGDLQVRHADGSEQYLTFHGQLEQPVPGEVVFADEAGTAHSRRWTHRQSALSAVSASTSEALVVVEALHDRALPDVERAAELLQGLCGSAASVTVRWLTASGDGSHG